MNGQSWFESGERLIDIDVDSWLIVGCQEMCFRMAENDRSCLVMLLFCVLQNGHICGFRVAAFRVVNTS